MINTVNIKFLKCTGFYEDTDSEVLKGLTSTHVGSGQCKNNVKLLL